MKKPLPVLFQAPEQIELPFPFLEKSFEQEPSVELLEKLYEFLRIKYY